MKKGIKNQEEIFQSNLIDEEGVVESLEILNHSNYNGFIKERLFNGIRIQERDVSFSKSTKIKINNNSPTFKMQFEINGCFSFITLKTTSTSFKIAQEHHQLFYFPKTEGFLHYQKKNKNKTLEIILSLDFIQRVCKNNWEILNVLRIALTKDVPFVFDKTKLISSEINLVIQQILNPPVKKDLQKAYLESKVIELLLLQINELSKQEEVPSYSMKYYSKIEATKNFIEANFNKNNITIPFIAKTIGLNTSYLKAGFKELYGATIFQYLTSLRMLHAKNLIEVTDNSIAEIANRVGYKYSQHFTKVFKKHFNKTPVLLRKEKKIKLGVF